MSVLILAHLVCDGCAARLGAEAGIRSTQLNEPLNRVRRRARQEGWVRYLNGDKPALHFCPRCQASPPRQLQAKLQRGAVPRHP